MEPKVPDLYEFLAEAELQQYYNSLKNELKITNLTHLKYATDEDLRQVSGLSRPEIRRLRKYYEKYFPHGYLNKIRRLLQNPRKDDCTASSPTSTVDAIKTCPSPSKIPNNKHIIPPDAICVNKQLGTGEFGIVQQGVWTNGTERIQVAIKCLCRERMQSNPMEFLKEAAIMHSIEHENIVRLYGVVLDTESLMLVTELAHLRSLLECLKDPGLRVSFLTVPTLCEFAAQICNGMMYLESKRFIHRDLAARNILVFSKNKVKISDFGLSRALGVGKDYYQTNFNINLKLPIAWCAPECINFLRFTHASDVWAYGVCLWEIFSYGFQPWAALTGHQILEAIDEPHYQRLEKPECCPKEYYSLMLKCWQHDASKRPKFTEIQQLLPEMKPEQLQTIVSFGEVKKDHLLYRLGEIITVLDKSSNSPYWKGVLNSGKTGLFDPANTVAYLDSLPSSVNRDSFSRTSERSSKRKIRTDMISRPQNDLKHTGHVGIDGVSFGDVAFLASPQNLPRQIVTPYKPSEDLEQTPLLLPPTPTSPDSIQTASGYFSETLQTGHQSFVNVGENHSSITDDHTAHASTVDGLSSAFDFKNIGFKDSNPFINTAILEEYNGKEPKADDQQAQHEYHEISDDDITADKVFDHGPSLLDEMEHVFKSMSTVSDQLPRMSPDMENVNTRNELTELSSKLNRKNSSSSGTNGSKTGSKSKNKKTSSVKPISVKDEKLLNQVIEMTNEISAKSMTDLVTDPNQQTSSPKRKFSFRFPHIHGVVGNDNARSGVGTILHHNTSTGSVVAGGHCGRSINSTDKDNPTSASSSSTQHHNTIVPSNVFREKRNFSEEAKNVPDLQRYRSLTGIESFQNYDIRIPLFDKESSDFCFEKSRELLSKPFRLGISTSTLDSKHFDKRTRDLIGENLMDIEKTLNALNLDFLQTYQELEKADSAETVFGETYPVIPGKKGALTSTLNRNSSQESNSKIITTGLKEKCAGSPLINKNPPAISHRFADINDSSTTLKSPKALQESKFVTHDFKFRAIDARMKDRADYYNLKNEYLSELTRKQQSQILSSSAVKKTKSDNQSFNHLYNIYSTPMQCRKFDEVNIAVPSTQPRQRSLSFTENYELKSPNAAIAVADMKNFTASKTKPQSSQPKLLRRVITCKPRSVRARNLRRLSYNPISMIDGSSSSSEGELDRSIAHSECDIRSRLNARRRRQYISRKSNSNSTSSQDKLYGSNASIKSAPQYNYNSDRQYYNYPYNYTDYGDGEEDENIFDFNVHKSAAVAPLIPPPANYTNEVTYQNKTLERDYLYSEFDVTKLTGKSPTTQSYFITQQQPPLTSTCVGSTGANVPLVTKSVCLPAQPHLQTQPQPGFQWPEKIHGAIVKRNDMLWRQKTGHHAVGAATNQMVYNTRNERPYSSDTSSTETDSVDFRRERVPIMPPSPAP